MRSQPKDPSSSKRLLTPPTTLSLLSAICGALNLSKGDIQSECRSTILYTSQMRQQLTLIGMSGRPCRIGENVARLISLFCWWAQLVVAGGLPQPCRTAAVLGASAHDGGAAFGGLLDGSTRGPGITGLAGLAGDDAGHPSYRGGRVSASGWARR